MAKGKKSSKGRGGKRSRFNLSSKGEMALAAVGVLVLGVAVFLVWSLAGPRLFRSEKREAQERQAAAQSEARWNTLLKDGVVVKVTAERQDVYVDAAKWAALLPTEREIACGAACSYHQWRRCFILDAATGDKLGFYFDGGKYQQVEKRE